MWQKCPNGMADRGKALPTSAASQETGVLTRTRAFDPTPKQSNEYVAGKQGVEAIIVAKAFAILRNDFGKQ